MMDARERELSQPRGLSFKRPWEEDMILTDTPSIWSGVIDPPVDVISCSRPPMPYLSGSGSISNTSLHRPASRNSTAKRARFEGLDHNAGSRENPDLIDITYSQNQGSPNPHFFPRGQSGDIQGSTDSKDISNLCRRCRRQATQDFDIFDSCEDCNRNPDLAHTTQAVAAGLTQLVDTLRSGKSSEHRGVRPRLEQLLAVPADCPPIAQFGLKQTLNWIVGRIHIVNHLADKLVQYVPPGAFQNLDTDGPRFSMSATDDLLGVTNRRADVVDSEDGFRKRPDATDTYSNAKNPTRRSSLTTVLSAADELPPMRSQPNYHASLSVSDHPGQRVSLMNPPPAPTRQLPSPPGRALPSPTSLTFSSPSAPPYGNTSQPVNHPLHSSHNQTSTNFLPPIFSGPGSDTALQAHLAALQHEVSVQKIALSSLQGEHDKLLAAFSRSQTRASALEKKHAVSDGEIYSLTEEKLRLQAQLVELERDVEELARSRDDFRQAAVQEGAQYVEIVKKASRLEEMAGEERKSWNKVKADLERRIEALTSTRSIDEGTASADVATVAQRLVEGLDTPASSVDLQTEFKSELAYESQTTGPTSYPSSKEHETIQILKEETRQLRHRCREAESALRVVRDEGHAMEAMVQALSLAGKRIWERADTQLSREALPEE